MASSSSESEEFLVGPMDVQDYDKCLDMAVEAFTTRNALVKHLKVPPSELREIFYKDTHESVRQGLCLVIKEKQHGDIVGFLFCNQCDFMQSDAELKPSHSNFRHSYDVGEALYHQAAKYTSIGMAHVARGETLHVICGGTAEGYEGKGLGTILRSKLLPFAQERGFQRVLVEAASPATIHIWTKLGYKLRSKTTLASFRGEKGIYHFQNIDPINTEYVIFEGIVDENSSRASDRIFAAFWLGVVVSKSRYWFKPYNGKVDSDTATTN